VAKVAERKDFEVGAKEVRANGTDRQCVEVKENEIRPITVYRTGKALRSGRTKRTGKASRSGRTEQTKKAFWSGQSERTGKVSRSWQR